MLIYIWLAWMFVFGTVIGSFLNVLIYRLPRGMSTFSPPSHCPQCGQRVRWYDNLPVVSYTLLRGRCRFCAASIPVTYLLVEIATGCIFAGVFALDIMFNWHRNVQLSGDIIQLYIWQGAVSVPMWIMAFTHATLFSLALVTLMCERQGFAMPIRLSIFGITFGLLTSLPGAWPTPSSAIDLKTEELVRKHQNLSTDIVPTVGQQLWPVWWPLPDSLTPESWQLGLGTALAGMIMGGILGMALGVALPHRSQRSWRFPHGPMFLAMVGTFLGWQPVLAIVSITVMVLLLTTLIPFKSYREILSRPVGILAILTPLIWLNWWWAAPSLDAVFMSLSGLLTMVSCLTIGLAVVRLMAREQSPPSEPTPPEPTAEVPSSVEATQQPLIEGPRPQSE